MCRYLLIFYLAHCRFLQFFFSILRLYVHVIELQTDTEILSKLLSKTFKRIPSQWTAPLAYRHKFSVFVWFLTKPIPKSLEPHSTITLYTDVYVCYFNLVDSLRILLLLNKPIGPVRIKWPVSGRFFFCLFSKICLF